eukprot:TRINITY_DN8684_c0_g1_i1.p1 TRINITY_DN8684_c0_g1~~TRINITY_DN8684_c0_g1_i1.p1  ORF type:complete len:441 (+),score=72.98 TRINITY_DN8684_c0_g1_i1:81-1403(+)
MVVSSFNRTLDKDATATMATVRCFFDITIGGKEAGRIVFELYPDKAPRTVENFRCLCVGNKGLGATTNKPLHYQGSKFHRVIEGFMLQGGDFSSQDGRGGESIYGGSFDDEKFILQHDKPFLLSMANRGPNTNGSQFFITTVPTPHLDNKHVVFGAVIRGSDVVQKIERLPTDSKDCPLSDVKIAKSGELVRKKKVVKAPGSSSESSSSDSSDSDDDDKDRKERKPSRREDRDRPSDRSRDRDADRDRRRRRSRSPRRRDDRRRDDRRDRRDSHRDRDRESSHRDRDGLMPKPTERPGRSGRKVRGRGVVRYRTPPKADDVEDDRATRLYSDLARERRPYRRDNRRQDSNGGRSAPPSRREGSGNDNGMSWDERREQDRRREEQDRLRREEAAKLAGKEAQDTDAKDDKMDSDADEAKDSRKAASDDGHARDGDVDARDD